MVIFYPVAGDGCPPSSGCRIADETQEWQNSREFGGQSTTNMCRDVRVSYLTDEGQKCFSDASVSVVLAYFSRAVSVYCTVVLYSQVKAL